MRAQAQGHSSAANSDGSASRGIRGFFGLGCVAFLGLVAFLGSSAPSVSAADECPNAIFRTGLSAKLPDCRAFEIVTPYLGGRTPLPSPVSTTGALSTDHFSSAPNSADGNSYLFVTLSTAPDFGGTPFINEYQAQRSASGWHTKLVGPTAPEARNMWTGGHTPQHGHAFVKVPSSGTDGYAGTLALTNGKDVTYVRYPDGSFGMVGEGTLPAAPDTDGFDNGTADDTEVQGMYISPGGGHIIFRSGGSPVQLLPNAPPNGTWAVYDRTPQGLKLSSILPGETTPTGGSGFAGASADGSVVMFENQNALYARVDNEYTVELGNERTLPSGAGLNCTAGPTSAVTKSYQWLRNGTPIPGATNATYKTQAVDEGKVVQCQVFALNANAGSTQTTPIGKVVAPAPATSPPQNPGSVPAPTQSATLTVGGLGGQTLTCAAGSFWQNSPSFSYQWYRNGVALSGNGADTDTYTVQEADLAVPAVFQCALTGTNAGGSTVRVSANRATSPAPSSPSAPAATAKTYFQNLVGNIPNGSFSGGPVAPVGVYGSAALYGQEGNIFSVDTATEEKTVLVDSGDAQVVNVSDDGSHIFFLSRSQLDGAEGTAGQPNVYVWSDAGIEFIATIAESDLFNFELSFDKWTYGPSGGSQARGVAVGRGVQAPQDLTHRVTPDGSVFVFETKAQVTSYNNNGKPEVYHYEVASDSLTCVSCDPSGDPPANGAQLVIPGGDTGVSRWTVIENVSEDGERVFFETRDGLLASDFDGKRDVYQWHNGVLSLIGSGNSVGDEELMGAAPDGSAVFIRSRDLLVQGLPDPGSPVIFAARVNGGFPPDESTVTEPCVADACQGAPTGSPVTPGAASAELRGQGNLKARRDCSGAALGARKLGNRARRLRAQARKAGDQPQARKLRRQAARLSKRAKQLRKSAKRCRNANRRAAR